MLQRSRGDLAADTRAVLLHAWAKARRFNVEPDTRSALSFDTRGLTQRPH
jgi:hypothetical protein